MPQQAARKYGYTYTFVAGFPGLLNPQSSIKRNKNSAEENSPPQRSTPQVESHPNHLGGRGEGPTGGRLGT
ncbi:unnamed protein product [Caretta caretta]